MNRRTRLVLSSLVLLLVLLGIPAWLAVRQERLDRALIAAIRKMNLQAALEALNAGADPNSRDLSSKMPSYWQVLLDSLRRKHPDDSSANTALLLALDWETLTEATGYQIGNGSPPAPDLRLIKALLDRGADDRVQAASHFRF